MDIADEVIANHYFIGFTEIAVKAIIFSIYVLNNTHSFLTTATAILLLCCNPTLVCSVPRFCFLFKCQINKITEYIGLCICYLSFNKILLRSILTHESVTHSSLDTVHHVPDEGISTVSSSTYKYKYL